MSRDTQTKIAEFIERKADKYPKLDLTNKALEENEL